MFHGELLQLLRNYQPSLVFFEVTPHSLQGLNQKRFVLKDREELLRKIGLTQGPKPFAAAAGKDNREFLNMSPPAV